MIYIILPCYNEELVVEESCRILLDYLHSLPEDIRLLFVDDGSRDSTWECLRTLHARHPEVRALRDVTQLRAAGSHPGRHGDLRG